MQRVDNVRKNDRSIRNLRIYFIDPTYGPPRLTDTNSPNFSERLLHRLSARIRAIGRPVVWCSTRFSLFLSLSLSGFSSLSLEP